MPVLVCCGLPTLSGHALLLPFSMLVLTAHTAHALIVVLQLQSAEEVARPQCDPQPNELPPPVHAQKWAA